VFVSSIVSKHKKLHAKFSIVQQQLIATFFKSAAIS